MKDRSSAPVLFFSLITLILFWSVIDFLLFVHDLRSTRTGPTLHTSIQPNAVVALTGGNGLRIALAVAYARSHQLPVLITGVHPDANLDDVHAISGVDRAFLTCCVDIDRKARNTVGNGRQIAAWAKPRGYRVIAMVTSDYHIDRALAEAKMAMPEASFLPITTRSENIYETYWWIDRETLLLLIREWAKLKISLVKLSLFSIFR